MKRSSRIKQSLTFVSGILLLVLLIATFFSMQYFQKQVKGLEVHILGQKDYERQYAFIVEDSTDSLYQEVYEGAREAGEKEKVYAEFMGEDLLVDYSKLQLLDIAINAKVDGIIIQGDQSLELSQRIVRALRQGIPVVTIGCDSVSSERTCYVDVSNYSLGQEYANEIRRMGSEQKSKVVILMGARPSQRENEINKSIRETLDSYATLDNKTFEVENILISEEGTFSAEESIRDIFLDSEELPDVLVCLNELYTTCVTQAIIDYNKVGTVEILGYFTNDTILDAIQDDVIHSTIAIDTDQMGAYCVDAISEYIDTGYVSEYLPVDLTMVTEKNVKGFIKDEENMAPQEK